MQSGNGWMGVKFKESGDRNRSHATHFYSFWGFLPFPIQLHAFVYGSFSGFGFFFFK
uniref:Transmembrane protein n=1 Tax=Manihot esculenta TaxID=3983 RepID=A0A2C9UK44_MANES